MASSKIESPAQIDRKPSHVTSSVPIWLVILLVTAVAAALRLYRLGYWSFWVDEMFTLSDSLDSSRLYHGLTYPLSYILIGASIHMLGVSEWSARIVPALFGIVTPAVIYLLARRSFGELPSAIAAAIIAVSPWHLYWSQMARFYTMTLLFSAASLLALHRGLEDNRRGHAAAAGILMALAALSHYSALLILAAICAYLVLLLLARWPRPSGLSAANLFIFLAPLILGAIVLGSRAASLLFGYAAGQPTGTSFANPIAGGAYMVVSIGYRLEPAIFLLALVGAWLGISRRDRGVLLLTSAVVVPAGLLVITGMLSHAENRYAFIVLPPAALLAGSSLAVVIHLLRARNPVLSLIVPLAIALPLLQHDAAYFSAVSNGERWNYRAAAAYLRAHARSGDLVYSPMHIPLSYYLKGANLTVQDLDADTDASAPPGRRSWIVMEDATRGESVPRSLSDWLERNCRLAAHFPASSPVANYGLSVYQVVTSGGR